MTSFLFSLYRKPIVAWKRRMRRRRTSDVKKMAGYAFRVLPFFKALVPPDNFRFEGKAEAEKGKKANLIIGEKRGFRAV